MPQLFLNNRVLIGRGVGFAALVCAVLAGLGFYWTPSQPFFVPETGLFFAALTGICVAVAVFLVRPAIAALTVTGEKASPQSRLRLPFIVFTIILFAILSEANSPRFVTGFTLDTDLQFWGWVLGMVSLLIGFDAMRIPRLNSVSRQDRIELTILAGVTLVGFFLRTYRLEDAVHVYIDEAHSQLGMIQLLDNPNLPIFQQISGYAALPHIYSYMELWGVNWFGGTLAGLRFMIAVMGTFTIPAIYLAGRWLFDARLGLLAACVLCIFPPHIHFSRAAMVMPFDPPFALLTIAFLARGMRRARWSDYAVAGVAFALSGLFYEGGRLLYQAVVVYFIGFMFVMTPRFRKHWRGVLAFLFSFSLVSFPYYYTLFNPQYYFAARLESEGARLKYLLEDFRAGKPPLEILQKHWDEAVQFTFYHTIYSIDRSQFYYGGASGIIIWYMVPFYLLGAFFTLFRTPRIGLMLWAWIIGAIAGISLIVSTDWTARFVVMFPVMALFIACGLRYVPEMVWPGRFDKRLLWGALGVIVVTLGVVNVNYYFNVHLPIYNVQMRSRELDFYDAFYTVSFNPGETHLYFLAMPAAKIYGPVFDGEVRLRGLNFKYFVNEKKETITVDWLRGLPRVDTLAFAVDPQENDVIATIREAFPDAKGPLPRVFDTVVENRRYAVFTIQLPPRLAAKPAS